MCLHSKYILWFSSWVEKYIHKKSHFPPHSPADGAIKLNILLCSREPARSTTGWLAVWSLQSGSGLVVWEGGARGCGSAEQQPVAAFQQSARVKEQKYITVFTMEGQELSGAALEQVGFIGQRRSPSNSLMQPTSSALGDTTQLEVLNVKYSMMKKGKVYLPITSTKYRRRFLVRHSDSAATETCLVQVQSSQFRHL